MFKEKFKKEKEGAEAEIRKNNRTIARSWSAFWPRLRYRALAVSLWSAFACASSIVSLVLAGRVMPSTVLLLMDMMGLAEEATVLDMILVLGSGALVMAMLYAALAIAFVKWLHGVVGRFLEKCRSRIGAKEVGK